MEGICRDHLFSISRQQEKTPQPIAGNTEANAAGTAKQSLAPGRM
jgi:hypothetical protein